MKKKIYSVLKYLVFLSIGAGLFWLAVKDTDIDKILLEFKNANYSWIALSVLSMFASHIIRAARWNQLLATLNYKTNTVTTFFAVMVGYFVNLAVPRLGEVTRCGVLANHDKLPVNSVIGTVIAERAFDTLCLAIIILFTILTQLYFLSDFLYQHIFNPVFSKFSSISNAILIIGGGIIVFLLVCILLYRALLPRLRKMKLFHKIKDLITGFWTGIKTIKNIKRKKLFILYSLLMWFSYSLTIYISFFAFSATKDLTLMDALTIMAIGSIGVVAPSPGGIGTYQYFVILSLVGLFHIERNTASAFANIVYFTQWFMIIFTGGISWILLFMSQKKAVVYENT